MDAAEFADWLAGIERLSGEQMRWRGPRLARLRRARVCGGVSQAAGGGRPRRPRRVTGLAGEAPRGSSGTRWGGLATRRSKRLGCAHCGADAVIGWGRSHGLPRHRCKSCGRTFNAATGTAMARLRKKDRWLDQAQAMIESLS